MNQAAHIAIVGLSNCADSRRPIVGWGISLLGHALAIVWLSHAPPPKLADSNPKQVRQIEVWLMTSAPKAPMWKAEPVAATAPSAPELIRSVSGSSPKVHQSHSADAPAMPSASQPAATIATVSALASESNPGKAPESDTPAFDLAAARASARAMTRADPIPTMGHTLRNAKKDANTSDRIQERFEQARRVDCLKPNESANLLANVALLAKGLVANAVDDSGCKW